MVAGKVIDHSELIDELTDGFVGRQRVRAAVANFRRVDAPALEPRR